MDSNPVPVAKNDNEKYCSECRAIIKLKAELCPKCGVRQHSVPVGSSQNKKAGAHSVSPETRSNTDIEPSTIEDIEIANKKKSEEQTRIYIVCVAFAVFAVGFLLFDNFTSTTSPSKGTSTNISSESICLAAIAKVMNQNPSRINTATRPNRLVSVYYTRTDGKNFEYNCKLSGNRILWQTYDYGSVGRWRNAPEDGKLTYSISGQTITISEKWSDGSGSSSNYKFN